MSEIVESFVVETQEIFDELNEDLVQLEHADDPEPLVDKVFRAVHTVKGTSSFLSLDQLNSLAHHFEDALNRLRKGDVTFRPDMMDVLFEAYDQMVALLQQVLDRDIVPLPIDDLVSGLKALGTIDGSGDGAAPEPVLVEAVTDSTRTTLRPGADVRSRRSASVRVDIDRLDHLIALVGELTASRTALAHIIGDLERVYGQTPRVQDLHEESNRIDRLADEMRKAVLTTRMVSVDRVFGKFPRVARDLGRSLGKDIRIECLGANTEIDRSVADEIGEALLHLVRNAIDHGIEPRNERVASGKPREGTILLEACRHDHCVEIAVEDDGRGLDPNAILQKAIRLGRISAHQASSLSETDIFGLIWEPGFSTTDVANRVSGRGVGMDVVQTSVTRLGGSIDVRSTRGGGARFSMRLPVAVSRTRCLIVRISGKRYVIPQADVTDVITLDPGEARAPTIVHNDRPIITMHPRHLLGPKGSVPEEPLAAVLSDGHRQCALVIDQLCGQEEVVYHPAPPGDDSSVGSGTTVLGDGRVASVIEAERVVRLAHHLRCSPPGALP